MLNVWYLLTFPACYLAGCFAPELARPIALLILGWSYYLILGKASVEAVILLAINARSIVGFAAAGNATAYLVLNVLTNYLPLCVLYVTSKGWARSNTKLPYTNVYTVLLILYLMVGLPATAGSFGLRVMPMIMIIIFASIYRYNANVMTIIQATRFIMVASIIAWIIPGYQELSNDRLQAGLVFGTEAPASLPFGLLPRAMGPFWDPRVMGIFGALYLAFAINQPYKSRAAKVFDIVTASIAICVTLSRGSIVTATLVGLAGIYPLIVRASSATVKVFTVCALVATLALLAVSWSDYIEPILLVSGQDPLAQRAVFREYALNMFAHAPFGSGVGAMRYLTNGINVGETFYDSATDAFLFILLAEVGIIGFAFFVLSFFELAWGRALVTKAIVVGFFVQMTGTDIPDFGPLYFAMLMLIFVLVGRKRRQLNITKI